MADRRAIIFAPQAVDDLTQIAAELAAHRGLDEGEALVERLRGEARRLSEFPFSGAVPKELEQSGRTDLRQIIYRRFRMFYQVDDDRVIVVLVTDGRRDIVSLLSQRLLHR